MSINATEYCSDICSDKTFRDNLIARLDQVIEALGGISFEGDFPTLIDATFLPLTSVPFGSLTDVFVKFLDDSNNKKYLSFENKTDQVIYVSFDGVETHGVLKVNGSWTLNFGSNFSFFTSSVWLKHLTGDAPLDGVVEISGYY